MSCDRIYMGAVCSCAPYIVHFLLMGVAVRACARVVVLNLRWQGWLLEAIALGIYDEAAGAAACALSPQSRGSTRC